MKRFKAQPRWRPEDLGNEGESAPGASGSDGDRFNLNPLAQNVALQFQAQTYSPRMLPGFVRLFEVLGMIALGALIHVFYVGSTAATVRAYAPLVVGGAALTVFLLQMSGVYTLPSLRTPLRTLPRVLSAHTFAFTLLVVVLFLLKQSETYSRVWFVLWYVLGALCLVGLRAIVGFIVRRWARNGMMERRAVIVGGGTPARNLARALEQQPDNDIRICGIFDDRDERRSPNIVAGYPKLGTIAELVEFARVARIDLLIISLPLSAEERILELLETLWVLPVDIRIAAVASNLRFRPRSYSRVRTVQMLDVYDRPITDWNSVKKRCFDIVFSLLALVLLWPVFIGAAIAVKLSSPGPVFFKQKRHGFNNETIEVFKFRSMYTKMSDPTARRAVTRGDPRVTAVGRFIRKTSIDELPQIFNVLRGDLSLVGPRPHALLASTYNRSYAEVVEGYFARHRVKPGVTGWAQINGWRGEIDHDDKIKNRIEFDLYYIENWSLWFDFKILCLTPVRLLNTENAY